MNNFKAIKDSAIEFLIEDKKKEYLCHVQFVHLIGEELINRYGGDHDVVAIASLLHDIGRGREVGDEPHSEAGVREVKKFLSEYKNDISDTDMELILRCIGSHGGNTQTQSIEEEIVISADSASKVRYHSSFMLMVKKEDYIDRAIWGLKYLEKGYRRVVFSNYKNELKPQYDRIREDYMKIINNELIT